VLLLSKEIGILQSNVLDLPDAACVVHVFEERTLPIAIDERVQEFSSGQSWSQEPSLSIVTILMVSKLSWPSFMPNAFAITLQTLKLDCWYSLRSDRRGWL
jgi:hypothetical protein